MKLFKTALYTLTIVCFTACPKPYFDVSEKSLDCDSNEDCTFAAAPDYCNVCNFKAMTRETAQELREYSERVPCEDNLVLCGLNLDAFADPYSQCIDGQCELVKSEFYIDVNEQENVCETDSDCGYAFVANYCDGCAAWAMTAENAREATEYRLAHPCPEEGDGVCELEAELYADPVSQCIRSQCQLAYPE